MHSISEATDAWNYLVKEAGIELTGRDSGLDERLRDYLDPAADSLHEVLSRSSIKDLLKAFFAVARPYVRMFEAILDFFKRADATEGGHHWVLKLGPSDIDELDLEHFAQQIQCWRGHGVAATQQRMLSFAAAEGLRSYLLKFVEPKAVPDDLESWHRTYQEGRYPDYPLHRVSGGFTTGRRELAEFVSLLNARAQATGHTRSQMLTRLRVGRYSRHDDAIEYLPLAQMESDYYIGITTRALLATLALEDAVQAEIDEHITKVMNDGDEQIGGSSPDIPDLMSLLRLPIWQKRNELYAVWIATEIASALSNHACKLHTDHGRLEFSFRETLLLSVLSARPFVRVFSERRSQLSPLAQSVERTEAIQPDYTFWKRLGERPEDCVLAIECKHYLKSGGKNFTAALNDYAWSLPNASVCLVNHGPVSDTVLAGVPAGVRSRCHVYERLMPGNIDGLDRFRSRIAAAVGAAASKYPTEMQRVYLGETALLVDVSPSMKPWLQGQARSEITTLALRLGHPPIASVDRELRQFRSASETGITSILEDLGDGTDLQEAVESLRLCFSTVVVVTDEEGVSTLSARGMRVQSGWRSEIKIVWIS